MKSPPATIEEEEIRIKFILDMIAEGRLRGEIKKLAAAKFEISPRTVERYHSHAVARLRQEIGKSTIDLRSESFAFYQAVIRDPKASISDRLKARQRIDKLLAVDAPMQHGPMELIVTPAANESENKDTQKGIAQIRSIYGVRPRPVESRGLAAAENKESAGALPVPDRLD